MILKFDLMMRDFELVMREIITFTETENNDELTAAIKKIAKSQQNYKSKHNYDLKKFGLTEERVKKDCKNIYLTFLT